MILDSANQCCPISIFKNSLCAQPEVPRPIGRPFRMEGGGTSNEGQLLDSSVAMRAASVKLDWARRGEPGLLQRKEGMKKVIQLVGNQPYLKSKHPYEARVYCRYQIGQG